MKISFSVLRNWQRGGEALQGDGLIKKSWTVRVWLTVEDEYKTQGRKGIDNKLY